MPAGDMLGGRVWESRHIRIADEAYMHSFPCSMCKGTSNARLRHELRELGGYCMSVAASPNPLRVWTGLLHGRVQLMATVLRRRVHAASPPPRCLADSVYVAL